jgi:hypothetical protein
MKGKTETWQKEFRIIYRDNQNPSGTHAWYLRWGGIESELGQFVMDLLAHQKEAVYQQGRADAEKNVAKVLKKIESTREK